MVRTTFADQKFGPAAPNAPRGWLGIVCAMAVLGMVAPSVGKDRPNVVLIMTDDQGFGDFGTHGNPAFRTPNLDAMASRSASMSTFYVCPVCSPTRACLMTGRYNYRTRVIDTYLGRSMMEPSEVTLAEVLSEAGYATGIFGKWHLGDCYPLRPMEQGFQMSLVHRGGGLAQPSEPRENDRRYTDAILFRNGQQVQTEGYCTDVYFDAALEYMDAAQQQGRNFFVYLPTNAPHSPYHDVPSKLLDDYRDRADELAQLLVTPTKNPQAIDTLARIGAMISNIDQNVGRLFAYLEDRQLTDNTLVIFLVDNGPNTLRYTRGLRGMKTDVYEGGVRSPLWLHWPARLSAGAKRDELCAHIDLMPTILDACGVGTPEGVQLDGRSFLTLLEQPDSPTWPERTIAIQTHRGDRPTRYHHFMIRDNRWKLVHPSGFGRERFEGRPKFELYDLQNDPGETHDLIDQQPDVAQRLRQAYDQWFDDVSNTRSDNYDPPRIVLGTSHEDPTVLTRQDWREGDWSQDSNGWWEVRVPAAGQFDVRLQFDPRDAAGVAQLVVGTVTQQVSLPPHADAADIRNVSLPAGDYRLRIDLQYGNKKVGPYQVFVHRR